MGVRRKLWTTRDLQDAAAAGALVEDFESEEDFVSAGFEDFVSVEEAEVDDVLFDAPERLSVR